MPRENRPSRKPARNVVNSQSNRVHTTQGQREISGFVREVRSSLDATRIAQARERQEQEERERLSALTWQQRRDHDNLRDLPDAYPDNDEYDDNVLHGRMPAQISHAGEALPEDSERADEDLFQGLRESHLVQLESMADAYMELGLHVVTRDGLAASYPPAEDAEVQDRRSLTLVDIFATSQQDLCIVAGDTLVSTACVRQGWMPASPWTPRVVFSIRVLEFHRVAHLRCPRLGIQAFVRGMCDIHGVAPRQWLGTQFGIAFDAYLAVLAIVDARVLVALGRDTPHWRLKNSCPCCLYKLEGEEHLELPLLATFDGNNSLSRFERRERVQMDDEGTTAPGTSRERYDNRVAPGDYYLPRVEVDKWGKDGESDLIKSFAPAMESGGSEVEEDSGCSERWQNMKEEVTSRAYRLYDETGIFPALCRHGFVLKIVDMVKSGELAKYPLAIVHHLLDILGTVAMGYDVGCKLDKMIKAHPALKDLAHEKAFRSLVGAFHGHGHNRLCGVDNLTIYVRGVGLEALEGCEILFSKSNVLASTTRYSSRFHRQRAITTYFKHADTFDTYQGLTLMLCNKYRRDLAIRQHTSRDEFETWRAKEKAHLCMLSKEPEVETLEMEYFQKLVNLMDADNRVAAIMGLFVTADAGAGYAEEVRVTRRMEMQRRHALEVQAKALAAVQELELRLEIAARWVLEDEKWVTMGLMLAKCNMSGTGGYKLRKHIVKALQARSKAMKNAIASYNQVAEEVVEYGFLADFDLLREGREDIRGELWAQPAGQAAMDQHYKLLRAEEELVRLNLEIRRLTHMADEAVFLRCEELRLREEGSAALAHQVALYRMQRGCFDALHMERLGKLRNEPRVTANMLPGTSVCRERHTPVVRDVDRMMRAPSPAPPAATEEEGTPPPSDDEEEDTGNDDENGVLAESFLSIVRITHDDAGGPGET
ncbi:hypothetical protein DFH09DRAFT_1095569 [Mycena vulgaris]|nr:hypothetical protein DFH09DRAFT_1095569 [Mycena vulgaris]